LKYRNQLSLQQDARLHLQREALQQRQAELRSVDQRIIELQERLQKRKSANILQQTNLNVNNNNNTSVKGNSMHVRSASTHVYPVQKNTKCNIVAVEPYNHTPNNSSVAPVNPKHSIIDDLALLKLSQDKNSAIHGLIDTDKNELNRHLLIKNQQQKDDKYQLMKQQQTQDESDDSRRNNLIGQQIQSGRKSNSTNDENNYNKNNNNDNDTSSMLQSHHVISSIISSNAAAAAAAAAVAKQQNEMESNNEKENKKSSLVENNNESFNELSGLETLKKIHSIHHIPSGNLVVPPRKPISKVAPNVNTQLTMNDNEKNKPALPPKPLKSNKLMLNDESNNSQQMSNLPIKAKPLTIKKQPLSEQPRLRNTSAPLLKPIQMMGNRKVEPNSTSSSHQQQFSDVTNNDINNERKSIEEDLNGNTNNINNINNNDNFIISKLINSTVHNLDFTTATNTSTNAITAPPPTADEPDRSATHHESTTIHQENERPFGINNNNNIVRRTRNLIGDSTKTKLARRVSFDPLALLLDASLEGELELVKKTAMQVPNPSASNDEGITALHNAICAGHLEIVK
jgi:apoptosis-stimulating of p53 protein 1